jgi:hypothetical protein
LASWGGGPCQCGCVRMDKGGKRCPIHTRTLAAPRSPSTSPLRTDPVWCWAPSPSPTRCLWPGLHWCVQEGVEKEERLKRMREELQQRELAECKQFLAVPSRTHVSRSEDGRRVLVGVRLYEVRGVCVGVGVVPV